MFEVTLQGDWAKTKGMMLALPKFIRTLQYNIVKDVADEYYGMLYGHFGEQDLPLEPLTEWYSQWKQKRGLDGRILIATGEMLNAIGIHEDGEGLFVGIKGGKRHQSGIDIALLALVHEYGSTARGIPARPVYRLTMQELKGKLTETVQLIIDKTVIEVFR